MLFTQGHRQQAGKQPTSNAVHGDGNGLMCLAADGAQGHATSAEALHDDCSRLNLLQGDCLPCWAQLQAVTQERGRALLEVLLVGCVRLLQAMGKAYYTRLGAAPCTMKSTIAPLVTA